MELVPCRYLPVDTHAEAQEMSPEFTDKTTFTAYLGRLVATAWAHKSEAALGVFLTVCAELVLAAHAASGNKISRDRLPESAMWIVGTYAGFLALLLFVEFVRAAWRIHSAQGTALIVARKSLEVAVAEHESEKKEGVLIERQKHESHYSQLAESRRKYEMQAEELRQRIMTLEATQPIIEPEAMFNAMERSGKILVSNIGNAPARDIAIAPIGGGNGVSFGLVRTLKPSDGKAEVLLLFNSHRTGVGNDAWSALSRALIYAECYENQLGRTIKCQTVIEWEGEPTPFTEWDPPQHVPLCLRYEDGRGAIYHSHDYVFVTLHGLAPNDSRIVIRKRLESERVFPASPLM